MSKDRSISGSRHLQCDESKSLQSLFECRLAYGAGRIRPGAWAGVVVLSGEDEGCEPEV